MTATPHPTYPNPSIREVICEIHFRLENGISWDPSWYSAFFKQVEDQFPIFQPVSLPIILGVTSLLPASSMVEVPQLIRYRHKERGVLLQLAEDRISVHILPKYPGWGQVSDDILYAWERLCSVIPIATIVRIGLRYVNGIERSGPDEELSKWLTATPYIPSAVLQSKPGFAVQTGVRLADKDRLQVGLADQPPAAGGFGTFLFDIDRITEQAISMPTGALLSEISRLHDDVWEVFQTARSSDLETLLRGELL